MGKVFTYSRQTGPDIYSEQTDETFCDTEDFEYEVDYDDLSEAIEEMVYDNYFRNISVDKEQKKKIMKAIKSFISNCDLSDTLEEYFEDELKDHFEEDAFNSLND